MSLAASRPIRLCADVLSEAKEHASATGTEIEMPTVSISEHGSCESIAAMIRQAHNLGDADPMGHMLRPRNCQSIVRDEKVKLHANGDTTVMTGNLFDAKTVAPPDIEYLVKKHWGELPDPSKPGTELSGMAHTVSNVRALKAIPTPGRYGGMALVDVTEQEKAQRMIRDLGRSIREQWCKGSIDDRKRMQQMLSASQQTATTDIGTDALSVRDTGSFITMLLSVADQLPGSEAASTAGADGTQSSWSQDTAATRRA